MMSKLPPARRVFLAHTTDLRPFTEAAKEAVAQAWDAYVEMATFPASPGSPVEQCRDMVGGCDVFVVIAGSHYGSSTAEATERSFVEMELDEAIRLEKPRLVFLLDGPPPTDPRQERFRSQLRDGGTVVKYVDGPEDLRFQLHAALVALPRPAAVVAVRNPYLGHVERIAPDRLEKRDQELAELAKYCTAPARAPYLWVRARAWAGKSALLAWFVLHPPPGVEVVSFFVTARLAGQDNRRAFAQALLAQLAHLLGEKEPVGLTEADLELRLSTMLNAAAAHCGACERRLVLVVDGLDEDRGIERDGYSIAALLPTHPVAGMRVVVSSRGHPPLPHEMSKHHPLRDPDVFWPLSPSPEAEVIRGDLRRDLDRLLTGTPLEQRLLGLVTAAGGGLTVDDLASLTDRKPRELDDVLGLPAWRVLERRPGRGDQDSYGLAHEELVVAVTERSSLQTSRTRLHGWADGYEQLGWPTDTPRYLLDGYVRMLHDTDEAPRILALATTPSRHDLLLRTTGADAAALAEITSALEFFHRRSDLPALARLAQHRDRLIRRNSALPARLPAVWVHLGQPTRAIELARTVSDPVRRVQALAAVAAALHERGDPERASMIADEAVACSRMITDPRTQAVERCALVATLAAVAGPTAVGALADEIERSADYRSELVEALARVGLYERAEAIARTLGDRNSQARALVCVWTACAQEHLVARARLLAEEIDVWGLPDYARVALRGPTPDPDEVHYERRERILYAIGSDDDLDRAEAMIDDCEGSPRRALLTLLPRSAAARRPDQVLRLVARLDAEAPDPNADGPDDVPAACALALARCGLSELASARAEVIERRARQVPDLDPADLLELCDVLAVLGEYERAEAVARTIADWRRPRALLDVADRAAAAGDAARARALTVEFADDHTDRWLAESAAVTRLVADPPDDPAEVRTHVWRIVSPALKMRVLRTLAVAMARAGRDDEVEQLMATARTDWYIDEGFEPDEVWIPLVAVAAERGDHERAEELTRRVTDRFGPYVGWYRDARRLALVEALCRLDGLPGSDVLTVRVESLAWTITGDRQRGAAVAALAVAARRGGAADRADGLVAEAERIARSLSADEQAKLLAALAPAVPPDRARSLIGTALQVGRWGGALPALAQVAPDVVVRLADDHLAAQP